MHNRMELKPWLAVGLRPCPRGHVGNWEGVLDLKVSTCAQNVCVCVCVTRYLTMGGRSQRKEGRDGKPLLFLTPKLFSLVGGTQSTLAGLATPVASLISPDVDESTPGSNGEQDWSLRVKAKSLRA